jgi:hypothetical protein
LGSFGGMLKRGAGVGREGQVVGGSVVGWGEKVLGVGGVRGGWVGE